MTSKYLKFIVLGAAGLCLIFFHACTSKDGFAGIYATAGGDKSGSTEIIMELNEDGKGSWKKLNETVFFGWEDDHKELRLHLKLGGVIIGKIDRDTIKISLPGDDNMLFKKVNVP
jgi:hypothetical protein